MPTATGLSTTPGQVASRNNTLPLDQMEQGKDRSDEASRHAPQGRLKVTAWRILNSSLILALGSYKAMTIRGGEPGALTGWECIAVMFCVLFWYWGSLIEQENPTLAPWLFIRDRSAPLWFLYDVVGSPPVNTTILQFSILVPSTSSGGERSRTFFIAFLIWAAITPFPMVISASQSTWLSYLVNSLDRPWLRALIPAAFNRADWVLQTLGLLFVIGMAIPLNVGATVLLLLRYETHSAFDALLLAVGLLVGTTASMGVPYVVHGLFQMWSRRRSRV
ncbi:hypothetical protein DFH07DRAFT_834279 [Mycena maculata]|uniref:Uncharacterized protein n=1 Tax=Mycena maculata TaxID=230809 RepID=A0AAD7N456_9AGAR|nr:hypothetical protein DFH07DRAFT_834279 [Mycena maculata]